MHANDNSFQWPTDLKKKLKSRKNHNPIYFASQTSIANCFPYNYPQYYKKFSSEEFERFVLSKVQRTIQHALNNASEIGSEYFISYAAYTLAIPLIDNNISVKQFLPTPNNLLNLELNWHGIELLDYVPGDTLNPLTREITKPFWNDLVPFESLTEGIKDFISKDISLYKQKSAINGLKGKNLKPYLHRYLNLFNQYLIDKYPNGLPLEMANKVIVFEIEETCEIVSISLDTNITNSSTYDYNKKIIISKVSGFNLVSGEWNFESLYIGYNAQFKRKPVEEFNKQLIMDLTIFGYIYQKRLVPKELQYDFN